MRFHRAVLERRRKKPALNSLGLHVPARLTILNTLIEWSLEISMTGQGEGEFISPAYSVLERFRIPPNRKAALDLDVIAFS
jgi:hypothetical protein